MHCCIKPLPLYDLEFDDGIELELIAANEEGIKLDKNDNLVNEIMNNDVNTNKYKEASILFSHYIGYPYIKKHYRINYNFKQCLQSLFLIHNETVNVWSHLLSGIVAIIVLIWKSTQEGKYIWLSDLILGGSIIIFFASATCHLLNPLCNSIKQNQFLFFFDFFAILIGIMIFEITFFYLLLINQIKVFNIIASITCILNTIPIVLKALIVYKNKLVDKKDIIYGSLVILNILLFIIVISLSNTTFFLKTDIIVPFIFTNLGVIGSIIINLIKGYPEKKFKNQCSLCGSSHQIWHFIVTTYLFSIYFQVENWERYAP
jgi:adiponectin receptor